jgi:hypothetical protein
MTEQKKEKTGLFKGLMMAYTILVLHVILVALVGCVVLFFRGITEYMVWILIGCSSLILFSGYYFFRRIRQEGRNLRDTLNTPMFNGRSLEISFLGGFASFKIGGPANMPPTLGMNDTFEPFRQIEDPATVRIRELKELVRMLENNMITIDEYNQTKQQLFNSSVNP